MTLLQWIALFAEFAGIVPAVVDEFAAVHPELSAPPPASPDGDDLHAAALAKVAAKHDYREPY